MPESLVEISWNISCKKTGTLETQKNNNIQTQLKTIPTEKRVFQAVKIRKRTWLG